MTTLSERGARSIFDEATGEIWLVLIALEADGATALRFTSDVAETTVQSGGHAYAPRPFEFALPRESGSEFAGVSMVIDDGDGAVSYWLRALTGEGKPRATIRVVIAAEPDFDQRQPMTFEITSMQSTEGAVRLDLAFRSAIAREPFPPVSYNASLFPALHD